MRRSPLRLLAPVCLTVAAAGAASVPRPSPDFAIKLIDGRQIRLSEYDGKVRVLAFILTTCPHCQQTIGYLSKMQSEFGPRGFQVLASAIEDRAAMHVAGFIERFKPPFPVGYNILDPVENYLHHPSFIRMLMPQVVFVDRERTIRAQYSGDDPFIMQNQEQNIRAEIEELLKGTPAVTKKHKSRKHKQSS